MNLIRSILVAGLLMGTAAVTFAAAPSKRAPHLASAMRTTEAFQELKAGDKVAMVCKECDSVAVKTIESTADAMVLCKEGDTVVCGSCNVTTRIVRHGPRSQGATRGEVRYVNPEGKECMFVVKLAN